MSRTTSPATVDGAPSTGGDLRAAALCFRPTRCERVAAWWAGRRDGRRGVLPDPETGLTSYLRHLDRMNATMVESERIRTQNALAGIDVEHAHCLEVRERCRDRLDSVADTAPAGGDAVAVVRAGRRHQHEVQHLRAQLDAANERATVLAEQRVDRVRVGAVRIARCVERTDQLMAVYWRAFERKHPELVELRATYRLPGASVPPVPASEA